jgi:hypothetical protein
MSLLDKVQTTLDPSIWLKNYKLKPKVRKQLIRELKRVIPKSTKIMDIFLLGSITGYKYTVRSDMDVNVMVDVSPADAKVLHVMARNFVNGKLVTGTRHPINYYILPYRKKSDFKDAKFGVYDILGDKWLIHPRLDPENIRDPKVEFKSELELANLYEKMLKEDVENEDVEDILDIERKVHVGREMAYDVGFGIPRRSLQNIIYKKLEHGPYGKVLQHAQKIRWIRRKKRKARMEMDK